MGDFGVAGQIGGDRNAALVGDGVRDRGADGARGVSPFPCKPDAPSGGLSFAAQYNRRNFMAKCAA